MRAHLLRVLEHRCTPTFPPANRGERGGGGGVLWEDGGEEPSAIGWVHAVLRKCNGGMDMVPELLQTARQEMQRGGLW